MIENDLYRWVGNLWEKEICMMSRYIRFLNFLIIRGNVN